MARLDFSDNREGPAVVPAGLGKLIERMDREGASLRQASGGGISARENTVAECPKPGRLARMQRSWTLRGHDRASVMVHLLLSHDRLAVEDAAGA